LRVDDTLSQTMHAFTRFSRFTDVLSGTTMFGAAGGPGFGIGGYGGVSQGADDSLAAGMDISVSPKLLTDWRIGYYRYNIGDHKYDQSTEFANTLGIPGINIASDSLTSGAPGFNIADADRSGNQGPNNPTGGGAQYGSALNITRCNCPLIEREDQFQLVNNWTKLFGNHAYKFGVDLRYGRNLRVPSDSDRAGILSFDPGPTSNGGSTAGLGMASFLLGDVSSFQRYVSVSTNAKEFQKRDFFYAQDTWRPRPSLTINYGLRYEMYFPESVNGKGNGASDGTERRRRRILDRRLPAGCRLRERSYQHGVGRRYQRLESAHRDRVVSGFEDRGSRPVTGAASIWASSDRSSAMWLRRTCRFWRTSR
jgi:outer membrane receptor protein involved in Fe transport